jgi:isopenicillin-N epimerase
MNPIKEQFLLDPSIIFLNHGSFGACPRPVFESYQAWQRELERRPVELLGRRAAGLLAEARARLAAYLGAETDEVVYFPNPTTAINMVARNLACRRGKDRSRISELPLLHLPLHRGDEILTTDHEYGAMDRTWYYICRITGARYVRRTFPLPVVSSTDFIDSFWEGVTPRTRVVFLSHITSPTALVFPVAEICRRARLEGILSIVDGAHAPGQIDLDLKEIGVDIYAGACHKWLSAPKGAGFLYVRRQIQDWLDPLVVSWGYESEQPGNSQFIDYHEWQGTRDLAAFLSVPAAIDFQAQNDWARVRKRCHVLACQTRQRLDALTGLPPICAEDRFFQMFAARLPQHNDIELLKSRLYQEFRIEVPLISWNDEKLIRVSIQGYNQQSDLEALLEALEKLLE